MSRRVTLLLGVLALVLACEGGGKRQLVIQLGAGGSSGGDSGMGGSDADLPCAGADCSEGEGGDACVACEDECERHGDCGDEYCSAEKICVGCLEDSHCPDEDKPVCGAAGECVECLSRADCQGERPECDTAESKCVECLSDDHCEGGFCDLEEYECQGP